MQNELDELRRRVLAMEDERALLTLTYGYWNAVDTKRPDLLLDVFAPGEILIDFQDMPVWRSRDAFVAFFTRLGMDPSRQENHFGQSPVIGFDGPDAARGSWRLQMFAYNYSERLIIRVSGAYDIGYVRSDGRWWIAAMIFRRYSLHTEQIGPGGTLTAVDFGGVAGQAAAHLFGPGEG